MSRSLVCCLAAALSLPAMAAPAPTRVAATFDLGGGNVRGLSISSDESVVGGVNGSGRLFVVDMETWDSVDTTLACGDEDVEATSVAIQGADERGLTSPPDGYFIYVGCEDGTIHTWNYYSDGRSSTEDLTEYSSSAGTTSPDSGDSGWLGGDDDDDDDSVEAEVFDVGANPVSALFVVDNFVWALLEPSGSQINVHYVDLEDESAGRAEDLPLGGFQEAVLVQSGTLNQLYIAHGSSEYSVVNLLDDGNTTPIFNNSVGIQIDADDMTPADLTGVYLADQSRGLFLYTGTAGTLPSTPVDGTLQGINSMVVSKNDARTANEYLVLDVDGDLQVFTVPYAPGSTPTEEFDMSFDGSAVTTFDMIEGPPGYIVAGADEGRVAILTANPFVDAVSLSPAVGVLQTEVTLTFDADGPGTFEVVVDGDRDDPNIGTTVASGTVDAAGQASVTFTVDDDFEEGDNDLWVHLSSAAGVGRARGTFRVDNAPPGVTLTEGALTWSDQKLIVTFNEVDVVDLAQYNVYVSEEAFDASDYPASGGPTGTIAASTNDEFTSQLVSPLAVSSGGGAKLEVDIGPLTNGTTYYVGVRVLDDGGQESEMSTVLSGVPDTPYTLCERVECDEGCGGTGCSTGAAGGMTWMGLLLMAAFARRRDDA